MLNAHRAILPFGPGLVPPWGPGGPGGPGGPLFSFNFVYLESVNFEAKAI